MQEDNVISLQKNVSSANQNQDMHLKDYPLYKARDISIFRAFQKLKNFAFSHLHRKAGKNRAELNNQFSYLTPSKSWSKGIAQIKSPIRRLAKTGDVIWVLFPLEGKKSADNHKENSAKTSNARKKSLHHHCSKPSTSRNNNNATNSGTEKVRPAIVHRIGDEKVWASFFDGSEIAVVLYKQCRLFLDWFQRVLVDPDLEKDQDRQLEVEAALSYYHQMNPDQCSRTQWHLGQTWKDHVKEIMQNFGPQSKPRGGEGETEHCRRFEQLRTPEERKRKYCMLIENQSVAGQRQSSKGAMVTDASRVGVSLFCRHTTETTLEEILTCVAEVESFDVHLLDQLLSGVPPPSLGPAAGAAVKESGGNGLRVAPTYRMLSEAVRANNLPALIFLLARCCEQGQRDLLLGRTSETRGTLLHEAAETGASHVIPTLVLAMQKAMEPPPSLKKNRGSGKKCMVLAHALTDKFGKTPLHVAAQRGTVEVLSLLIHTGADLEIRDSDGYTPLMWCAESGAGPNHASCAAVLLEAGAQVNAADRRGMTTLFWAVSYGLDTLAPILITHGAHYYEPSPKAPVPLRCGTTKKKKNNEDGSTSLLAAAAALTPKQRYSLSQYAKDISLNLEAPVAVKLGSGTVEEALAFPPFGYISESIGNPDMAGSYMKGRGCDCKKDCRKNPNCKCIQLNGQRSPYSADGTLDMERTVVYECGNWCACVDCTLVQSQMSLQVPVRVTYLEKKGWGLFYDGKIIMKKGTFLCCYVGEIITKSEYEERELSRLRKGDETTYAIVVEPRSASGRFVIDSRWVGNAGRLMNHSCQGNMELRKVYTSRKYPSLAFFASRDVLPGEELTWNYDRKFDNKKSEKTGIKCMCGAKKCKGYL